MSMIEDTELLRRYAETRSEAAFAELVRRHLNLVYSAALRQVGGDAHLAEDVTQSVFGDLARKASSLSQHSLLAGWLYTSAHYAAAKTVRGEQRRRIREQKAHLMQQTNANPNSPLPWEQLRPVLDEAMHELPKVDRDAILQRYFEGKPFLQIAAKLGLTENAARMRVERALEKLRTSLATRGVASTSAALAAVLGAQAVSAAPAALTATVVGASLASVAIVGGGAVSAWGVLSTVKLKTVFLVAGPLAVAVTLLIQQNSLGQLRKENAALRQAGIRTTPEPAMLSNADTEELERLRREHLDLLRLRGEVARLRREMAEVKSAQASVIATNETTEAPVQKESPQQINVKARFVSGSDNVLETFGIFGENTSAIIVPLELEKMIKRFRESEKIELLGEQQVTTLSGRQAQVTASLSETNGTVISESGHSLDVVPTMREDGHTIELKLFVARYIGKQIELDENGVAKLPVYRPDERIVTSAVVWDAQTVAVSKRFDGKMMVIFVTPTLVDPAGNPVHSDPGQ